ncbi:tetratricopeptide repeat protein [Reyranella sp.]|uniref:tetratricopeptide repeat protein n=1 Tax=Reyranella sp. TaxID=1929291 RepID=UPI003784C3C6
MAIDITPSADDYNLLGWGLSFYWAPKTHIALHPRQRLVTEWGLREASIIDWLDHPAVDLFAARAYFEKAAEGNSWEGMTNLGVMLRDGIGGPADQARAARLLERAAEALDPIPIHQLSKCYRDGVGVEVDPQHAAYLSELAKVREDELRDELWRTVDGWASKTRGAT